MSTETIKCPSCEWTGKRLAMHYAQSPKCKPEGVTVETEDQYTISGPPGVIGAFLMLAQGSQYGPQVYHHMRSMSTFDSAEGKWMLLARPGDSHVKAVCQGHPHVESALRLELDNLKRKLYDDMPKMSPSDAGRFPKKAQQMMEQKAKYEQEIAPPMRERIREIERKLEDMAKPIEIVCELAKLRGQKVTVIV